MGAGYVQFKGQISSSRRHVNLVEVSGAEEGVHFRSDDGVRGDFSPVANVGICERHCLAVLAEKAVLQRGGGGEVLG